MDKIDYKKELQELYKPGIKEVSVVHCLLSVNGKGSRVRVLGVGAIPVGVLTEQLS